MSRKTRKPRRDDGPVESLPDGWEHFTSPDGHVYYHNAATRESRWEFPFKKNEEGSIDSESTNGKKSVLDQEPPLMRSPKVKKEKKKRNKMPLEQEPVAATVKPPNVTFLQLQKSLGGKLEVIQGKSLPPMGNIRREGMSKYTGGIIGQEVTTPLRSFDDEYEAETAGMSAAERLRFLRKKRQENMMLKRESITGDDFMTEVANNMKKKGVVVWKKEGRERDEKMSSWDDQEKAEEERKRRQMQDEVEMKKQEAERKKREKQGAKEREERREKKHVEQLELEHHEQEQGEENRNKQGKKGKHEHKENDDKLGERNADHAADCHEISASGQDVDNHSSFAESIVEQDDEDLDASSPERVTHRRHNRSQGSKHGIPISRQAIKHMESVEDDHPPADDTSPSPKSELKVDTVQKKQRMREERRARKRREKDMLVASKSSLVTPELPQTGLNELNDESQTGLASSIEVDEDAKAREKHLRREMRRMAKLKAALDAQNLDATGGQKNAQPVQSSEPHTDNSNGPTIGLVHGGSYPVSGQPLPGQPLPGQPPISGGMCPPYPYMMMPPSPYGFCYPYMHPYPTPMPMYPPGMMLPGYQSMASTPPHSANGMAMPSALVPYGTDSTLANAFGYDMNFGGMPSSPELSRCDCCKGLGVGLVEKNGVCAHCNRLRLAFIVDSAQMRLRCSVCGGWGFQLLRANGMCEHCTRKTAPKSQRRLSAAAKARRPSSVATTVTEVLPRPASAKTKSEIDGSDDIDWDQSSSDDSGWDD